ncbi:MAG: hypothetical protein WBQ59_09850 [Candidatus Acidiferrum sp.]
MSGRQSKHVRKRVRQRARHQKRVQEFVRAIKHPHVPVAPRLPSLASVIADLQK